MERLSAPDRELDQRQSAGIIVRLMLRAATQNEVYITYEDTVSGDFFINDVPPEKAAHAFDHPNAYRPLEAEMDQA